MKSDQILIFATLIISIIVLMVAMIGYLEYRRSQRRRDGREEEDRNRERLRRDDDLARADQAAHIQHELEERRIELERSRISAEHGASFRAAKMEQDRFMATNSGAGSGGYVLIDVPNADRSLFHDLSKGFEDYARLKGYGVTFSIDNSWEGRTAYKFTVVSRVVAVGSEQVRSDFKEYAERVRHDDDDFEDMPIITNLAEHNLMVTTLRNRIVFFRANYKAYKNTITLLEKLITSDHFFPALPQPPVIIHNGVNMDSRNYNATNSSRLTQGEGNTYSDSSINIGGSVNEKMERIAALDEMIAKLRTVESIDPAIAKAELDLTKVREELADYPEPNESSIRRWLEHAKNLMTAAILGHELYEGSVSLWQMFGM